MDKKQFEIEKHNWDMRYLPKITETDMNNMYEEYIKNHPDLLEQKE